MITPGLIQEALASKRLDGDTIAIPNIDTLRSVIQSWREHATFKARDGFTAFELMNHIMNLAEYALNEREGKDALLRDR